MKQIKIDCCKHCPFLDPFFNDVCRHAKTDGMYIEDINALIEDCPLEDWKEE